ncbi:hypothetical protein RAM80_03650 [Pseudomonas sp. App30]|uniref:hypothetical protein n=1 Tax=Pseudomonas sp. App30 TaxID=3068990 RepID=UPI003A804C79
MLDDYAHMEAAPAWIRRYRTLIRVAFVLCVLPAGVVALVLALLHRRRSPPVAAAVRPRQSLAHRGVP